jgi:hypothetical protein
MSHDPAQQTRIEAAKLLGARQALGAIAGRCSAAEATILRDLREGRKYLGFSPNWAHFCAHHLHISKRNADRIIGLLNELGPGYFTLAQLTHITADEFRAIAPAVKDNCLEYHGEAIALIEENAAQLAEALGKMREAAPQSSAPPRRAAPTPGERVLALERRFAGMMAELKALAREPMPENVDFEYVLTVIHADLAEAEVEWKVAHKKPAPLPRGW